MKIKRFTGENMQEAMRQVRDEMGGDAVILSTKSVVNGSGITGIFRRPGVEITAAIDSDIHQSPPLNRDVYQRSPRLFDLISPIKEEIGELKGMLQRLSEGLYRDGWHDGIRLNNNLLRLYNIMAYNGLERAIVLQTIREVNSKVSGDDLSDYEKVSNMVTETLERCIKIGEIIKGDSNRHRIAAFIGPTGTGKTTTIAKLATYFTTNEGMDIGLITIDTYRIGAAEQLKIYGRILGIPVRTVCLKDELIATLREYNDKDLVLIDTAGRSYRNEEQMGELIRFLDIDLPVYKYLVLTSSTENNTIVETINRFMKVYPDSLIFTKIDETGYFGNILNTSLRFDLPVSYLTTGQVIPDDIEIATSSRIGGLVLKGYERDNE